MNIKFMYPGVLWLLGLLPLLFYLLRVLQKKRSEKLKINAVLSEYKTPFYLKLKPYLFVLQLLALGFFIIALARPRDAIKSNYTEENNGIDIIIATDVSGSMLATDLQPNRLEAVKKVAFNFVKNRQNDRIGIVVYAGESYTKSPLTSDKNMVLQAVQDIEYNSLVLEDGTALGVGLATAINRIKDSKAKSKIIILLTDGVSNVGQLDPVSAAEIALQLGIKVYTIGVGTNGEASMPVSRDPFGNLIYQNQKVEIDESLMKKIATITNGKYYRAYSTDRLETIYDEINKLEKTKISETRFMMFDEEFRMFVYLGLFFLILEFVLQCTIYKSIF